MYVWKGQLRLDLPVEGDEWGDDEISLRDARYTFKFAHRLSDTYTWIHTYIHTLQWSYTHIHKNYMQFIHTCIDCRSSQLYTYIYVNIHTYIHTHIHTSCRHLWVCCKALCRATEAGRCRPGAQSNLCCYMKHVMYITIYASDRMYVLRKYDSWTTNGHAVTVLAECMYVCMYVSMYVSKYISMYRMCVCTVRAYLWSGRSVLWERIGGRYEGPGLPSAVFALGSEAAPPHPPRRYRWQLRLDPLSPCTYVIAILLSIIIMMIWRWNVNMNYSHSLTVESARHPDQMFPNISKKK